MTAALARHHASQGRRVRVFKTGPDFLDPMILECASGQAVYQLDLWMGGEEHCRRLLYDAAGEADLILVEGAMGLHDGTPSSADLARLFAIPVAAIIDARAMAQTFGAIAYGLEHYAGDLPFHGVLANRVASARHAQLLRAGTPASLRFLGSLPRDERSELPDRHLGLVQAQEVEDLEQRLQRAAALIADTELATLPAEVEFRPSSAPALPKPLAGVRIAVARDLAFSFLYPANLDLLRSMGAELVFFSPLADEGLPTVDSVYLPGGYPELHLEALGAHRALAGALLRHAQSGKPLYAECGGMLYLLESVTDLQGRRALMAGILPGDALLHARLKGLGYQSAAMPGGVLRGHTFHHSSIENTLQPASWAQRREDGSAGEAIFARGRLLASYFHAYFPSNPQAAAQLFVP